VLHFAGLIYSYESKFKGQKTVLLDVLGAGSNSKLMIAEQSSFVTPEGQDWHQLHRAAMSETDRKKLPLRIHEAERALARRSRELFALRGDNLEEREAIDDAVYTLRALSYCIRLKSTA